MNSRQVILGNQNVQIHDASGATVRITYNGSTRLVPLDPALIPIGPSVVHPTRLLRARAGIIPFTAHREVLDDLRTWCHNGAPFGIRLVGGRGGAGKTRLGVQLCCEMREHRWLTGLLARTADEAALEALVTAETARLVVIDYAESRVDVLSSLLPMLGSHASEKNPIRVLLLVRAAPRHGDDWTEALRGCSEALDAVADTVETHALRDAAFGLDDRCTLFDAAAGALTGRLGGVVPDPPAELSSPLFATPLPVVAAAYLAVADPRHRIDTQAQLFEGLLEHEDRYWESTGPGTPSDPELRRRIVALGTLAGAESEPEAADLLALVPDLGPESPLERRRSLARWVHKLYPSPRWWNPVEPDLLGEHLVASTYGDQLDVLGGAIQDRSAEALIHPINLFTRLALDRPDLAARLRSVITTTFSDLCARAVDQAGTETDLQRLLGVGLLAPALSRLVALVPPDPAALPAILDDFPRRPDLTLTPLAAILTDQVTRYYRPLAKANPAAYLPNLATSLNNLSVHLGELGRPEDGLAAIEEAVKIRRALAKANPAAYLPDLATSLNNLSVHLGEIGRREDGLAAIEEAVKIRRALAKANPAAYLPDLATSLNNLSVRMEELGRPEDGLAATEEAVKIRRALAKANPAAYLPDLATSLNNLSVHLGEIGRREDGLAAIEEAVKIRRALAKANPAAYLPDLATSLNNLSVGLGELGYREDGLAASEEAVEVYRALAKANPAAHLPDLATSLNNLSVDLGELGRPEDGLAAIEEAVKIRRALVEANPAAYLPDLATSLNNLSVDLGRLGRREDGLAASEEAVEVYRALAEANPAAHLPSLAMSLNNLSIGLRKLGRREDGLAASEEAVEVYRALIEANPAAHLPDLATSLNNLAADLEGLGRQEEAKRIRSDAAEAEAMCRREGWIRNSS